MANDYEEIRKQRVLENQRRFEELGIANISRSLSQISNAEKKKPERRARVPRPRADASTSEPRRSTRERTQVASYRDDVTIDVGERRGRRGRSSGSNWDSNWATYVARPVEECRIASFQEKARALEAAEKLQISLESDNPCFIKQMVRSHVYSCFWLGLPSRFCEEHMPKAHSTDFVLEDENGSEFPAVYLGKRAGLSGGWRAFALEHKIDDGDALVFDMVEESRFKVYIVRAVEFSNTDDSEPDEAPQKKAKNSKRSRTKKGKKSSGTDDSESEDSENEEAGPQKKAKKLKHGAGKKKNGKKPADDSESGSGTEDDDAPKKVQKQKKNTTADDPAVDAGRRRSARLKSQ